MIIGHDRPVPLESLCTSLHSFIRSNKRGECLMVLDNEFKVDELVRLIVFLISGCLNISFKVVIIVLDFRG